MSTRSAIIIENQDGTAEGIYCHSDGYLDHQKPILLGHYGNEEKVRELIALGDISVLGEDIGEQQDFNQYTPGVVLAYGRDRGEKGTEAKSDSSWRKVAENIGHNGYIYVFRAVTQAWMFSRKESGELVFLTNANDNHGDDDE
jgi:hypothetical protein